MAAKKKKKKPSPPKVRRGWGINPKTRVTPSIKEYKRSEGKKVDPKDFPGYGQ